MVKSSAVVFLLVFVATVSGLLSGIAVHILDSVSGLPEVHTVHLVRRFYTAYYYKTGRAPQSTAQLRAALTPKFREELDEALAESPTSDFEFVIIKSTNGNPHLVGIFRYPDSIDFATALIPDRPPEYVDEMFIRDGTSGVAQ